MFFDTIRKALSQSTSIAIPKQQQLAAACMAAARLCKAATYINHNDSANVFFSLVGVIFNDLKVLLFSFSYFY